MTTQTGHLLCVPAFAAALGAVLAVSAPAVSAAEKGAQAQEKCFGIALLLLLMARDAGPLSLDQLVAGRTRH